jgi:transposase
MPRSVPLMVRQAMFQRWQKGVPVSTLAEEMGLSERTVRNLVRRFVQRGKQGLRADYARCATKAAPKSSVAFQRAMQMRQQHPSWGAGLIRILLTEELKASPSERTLQRWLRQAKQTPAPPGRRPSSDAYRACRPHEVWQMDAAEQMVLAGGQGVSWLRLVDECSGAVLQTTVFPPKVLEPGGTVRSAKRVA